MHHLHPQTRFRRRNNNNNTTTPATMPRRGGGRGTSIFSALPWALKSTLRSNPSVDTMEPPNNHAPTPAELLPTQPPSEDEADEEEVERAAPATPNPVAVTSNGENSRVTRASAKAGAKREGEALAELASPSKRQRRRAEPTATPVQIEAHTGTERHAWDCRGLVPRYESPKDVPAHLKKCTCIPLYVVQPHPFLHNVPPPPPFLRRLPHPAADSQTSSNATPSSPPTRASHSS